jgi:hypothetical protein
MHPGLIALARLLARAAASDAKAASDDAGSGPLQENHHDHS